MTIEARVEPLTGRLPSIRWHWDPETDILSGSFQDVAASGVTGTLELTDAEGSVAVVDVVGGVVRGVDVVVWPEVTTRPHLSPPAAAREGRVLLPSRNSPDAAASVELDTALAVATDRGESTFHLRLGSRRPVEAVRVADNLLIEIDGRQHLAGFWLLNVEPFPAEQEFAADEPGRP